jgi:AhpD family alkylhydroperoxidase
VFPKPTFTASEMVAALTDFLPHVPRLFAAVAGPGRIDPRLREIVLLAVSEAHACRYCRAAHRELAVGAGVTGEEMDALHAQRWRDLGPRDHAAVVSALRRAGFGVPEANADDPALEEHFVPGEVAALAALVDAIRIANLSGNTVDMLLGRIRGTTRPRRDSSLPSELAVASLWALGAVPAGLGIAGGSVWRRVRGRSG